MVGGADCSQRDTNHNYKDKHEQIYLYKIQTLQILEKTTLSKLGTPDPNVLKVSNLAMRCDSTCYVINSFVTIQSVSPRAFFLILEFP